MTFTNEVRKLEAKYGYERREAIINAAEKRREDRFLEQEYAHEAYLERRYSGSLGY